MKLSEKKTDSKAKREPTGEATARGFEFGAVAVAIAIVVFVPVVLDPNATDPNQIYYPPKFTVLMGFSAALLVTVLGFLVTSRKALLRVPVLVPALTLLGVSALSALFSEDSWHSLFGDRKEGLLTLGAGVLLFYALARCLNSPLRVRLFLAAAVTTAVLVSLYGISQKYGLDMTSGWRVSWYKDLGRPFSTIGNSIALASYLTLTMGAAVALCFKAGSSSWRYRTPWLFALAVIGACWLYTDTRGALLGTMVALPIVLWLSQRRMGTVRPLLIPLATLLGAVAVALAASAAFGNLAPSTRTMAFLVSTRGLAILAAYLAFIGVVLWLSRRGTRAVRRFMVTLAILVGVGVAAIGLAAGSGSLTLPERLTTSITGEASLQVRLYIWRDTVSMILDRPLLGHGPDNFTEPFSSYYISDALTADITSPDGKAWKVDRAHNDLLQVAATTGILGLAAYLWVLVSYFRNVYRRGGWPLIALFGGVTAYIFQIQTAFSSNATSIVFWGLLGASVALMRLQDREGRDPETPPEPESPKEALTTETPRRARVYELLVVTIIVGVLAAVAIPTFLNQREQAAYIEQVRVILNVQKTVSVYEQVRELGGTYPEDGVYTSPEVIIGHNEDFSPSFVPARNITITTDTTPAGDFTVEGESSTLSGTFRYSYDSATGTYTGPIEVTP